MNFSFFKYKSHVENGDTVIVYMGRTNKKALQIKNGSVLNTKFGVFTHQNLIGQKYGTKVYSSSKKGWLYLLYATPELWTTTLPHRTQILYNTDISMVLLQLNLKPGSIVVESGTGSGSMSHSIMRTIAPTGHLYTFEFHEKRANMAREEFSQHGFGDIVTVKNKNVLLEGFDLDHIADAVFLDLPSPWDAIKFSKDALKTSGGHLCSFSPCIEQVQQTCISLEDQGFQDIRTMECLLQRYDVKPVTMLEPQFGQTDSELVEPRRKRLHEEVDVELEVVEECNLEENNEPVAIKNPRTATVTKSETVDIVVTCPMRQIPGHTGYLTFAVLYSTAE